MRSPVYGLLVCLCPVLGAPVVTDPVANACSPLCSGETNVEIQCAKDKGCYQPVIKANPVFFEDCWKDCWSLAGKCFSLCAENFDSILGQCYTGCKPSLNVDCIAGCFDLSFTSIKHTSLNETGNVTDIIGNSTNENMDNILFPFSIGQDLPGATSNLTSHKAIILKLVGVSGDWFIYQEVTADDNTDQTKTSDIDSKTRSRPDGDRIQVLGIDELDGFYRGADGLLRKRIEHTYDKELWKRIIAQYEQKIGIHNKPLADNQGSKPTRDIEQNIETVKSLQNISLSFSGTVFVVNRNK